MKKILLLILVLLFLIITVQAQNDHLKLLAVTELPNGTFIGGQADLSLEIRDGTGKVFIDTYPLSKFDTQLSIRFAKEIACKFAEVDCLKKDFLYTIRANTQIVGGPSAGAAIAVITFAQLKGLDLDESAVITGTISSGRLIGNVGGIKEKIDGASRTEIKKVLIPISEVYLQQEDNTSLNMIEYAKNLSIEVVPVSDLEDALFHFTGKDFKKQINFSVSSTYFNIMKNISEELCGRSYSIIRLIQNSSFKIDNTTYYNVPINQTFKEALELLNHSNISQQNDSYYSASSQCYGANIYLNYIYLLSQNFSDEYYRQRIKAIKLSIDLFEDNVTMDDYQTITELQTAMIVRQRLDEAREYLQDAEPYFLNNSNVTVIINETAQNISVVTNRLAMGKAIYYLALAIERLRTASSWAKLFNMEGEEYLLNQDSLRLSCKNIIDNSFSLIQYARLALPTLFIKQESELKDLSKMNDSLYCIASASRIKAEINSVVGSFGIKQDNITSLVDRKLGKAREVIAEETQSNRFPILGYSYYEYSKSLRDIDPISSLLYSEYALELSNLDLYFEQSYPMTTKRYEIVTKPKANPIKYVLRVLILCVIFLLLGLIFGVKLTRGYFNKYYIYRKKKKVKT